MFKLAAESEWDRLHREVLAAKVDEEESRNRREEAERQLFKAEQADALRRQEAQQASSSGRGGVSSGSSVMGAGLIGPRKKTVGKKSTRMAALMAGAGLLRVRQDVGLGRQGLGRESPTQLNNKA